MVNVRAQNFHHLSTLDYVPAKLIFFLTLRDNVVFEFRLQDKERELHMNFEKPQAFFHQLKSLSAAFDLNKHFGLAFATFFV